MSYWQHLPQQDSDTSATLKCRGVNLPGKTLTHVTEILPSLVLRQSIWRCILHSSSEDPQRTESQWPRAVTNLIPHHGIGVPSFPVSLLPVPLLPPEITSQSELAAWKPLLEALLFGEDPTYDGFKMYLDKNWPWQLRGMRTLKWWYHLKTSSNRI